MRRVWILGPVALLLAACGGGSGSSKSSNATGPPLETINLSEKEFSITPATISVSKAGTYAFHATNNGQIAHALEVEGNGVESKIGAIQPGSSATLTVDLTKTGNYDVYCPIDGHRSKGMQVKLTVGASSGGPGGQTTTQQTSTGGTTTTKGGYGNY